MQKRGPVVAGSDNPLPCRGAARRGGQTPTPTSLNVWSAAIAVLASCPLYACACRCRAAAGSGFEGGAVRCPASLRAGRRSGRGRGRRGVRWAVRPVPPGQTADCARLARLAAMTTARRPPRPCDVERCLPGAGGLPPQAGRVASGLWRQAVGRGVKIWRKALPLRSEAQERWCLAWEAGGRVFERSESRGGQGAERLVGLQRSAGAGVSRIASPGSVHNSGEARRP